MRRIFLVFLSILILSALIIYTPPSHAQNQSCDVNNLPTCNDPNGPCFQQLQQCASTLQQALDMSLKATQPLQSQLDSQRAQIASIQKSVSAIENNLTVKKQQIDQGYKDLAKQQIILDQTIRDFYIKSYYNSPLLILLSAPSASEITQILGYQKATADRDKAIITNIALSIQSLEDRKKGLEDEQARLTALKENLDAQSAKLDKIVGGARAYQTALSNQIAVLSQTQQNLLAQKYASLGISLSAYNMQGGCKSDLLPGAPDPVFSPKFGFFSYGVPNRVGLNQFGAWGRAKAGQDAPTILNAYYNFDSISSVNTNTQITVTGYGTYSLEEYMRRIYEVPDSWTDNNLAALKAQVIAARSYVLAYTNNGQSPICATDQCQVFQSNVKGGNWDQAVSQTAGQVMVQGGQPIKAWFSSTHGGYGFTSSDIGWSGTSFTKRFTDTTGPVNSFSDLQNLAYDRGSPWFYCDWGSRGGTAWLRSEEVADIVNVVMLAQADSSVKEHLYQPDKPNPAGTDTWNSDRVKQELQNRGITPFGSISGINVSADFSTGRVTNVNVSGDAPPRSFPGDFFKTYFDIRAPANIQIVGPLYNVQQ